MNSLAATVLSPESTETGWKHCPTKHIPISFVAGRLAVNENTLIEMLDLKDGRSYQAQRKALYRFLRVNNIEALPGRVWPLRKVEQAVIGKS